MQVNVLPEYLTDRWNHILISYSLRVNYSQSDMDCENVQSQAWKNHPSAQVKSPRMHGGPTGSCMVSSRVSDCHGHARRWPGQAQQGATEWVAKSVNADPLSLTVEGQPGGYHPRQHQRIIIIIITVPKGFCRVKFSWKVDISVAHSHRVHNLHCHGLTWTIYTLPVQWYGHALQY